MEIRVRFSNSGFIELKTDQQETTCFTWDEANKVYEHLKDVIYDLEIFMEEKRKQ